MANMRDELAELLRVDMSGCEGDPATEMAEYLISQGVILLPFKIQVGMPVYLLYLTQEDDIAMDEGVVQVITQRADGLWFKAAYKNISYFWSKTTDVGKYIFFSKEEALKAFKLRNLEAQGV